MSPYTAPAPAPAPVTVPVSHAAAAIASTSEEDQLCVLCLDAVRTHLFVPCGHLAVCEACSERIQDAADLDEHAIAACVRCPLCRQASSQVIRLYS